MMTKDRREYYKEYYKAHRDELNAKHKAYNKSHRYELKAYERMDVRQRKHSIRNQSRWYLSKHGTKIPGYQIHHCCTYDEPYKFIYCSKEIHQLIHNYLRKNKIDADSDHYKEIEHLLDDSVILFGISDGDK